MEPRGRIHVVAGVLSSSAEPGAVMLFRRAPQERHAGHWEFPGGKVEAGETHESALRRELREELQADVGVGEHICSVSDERITLHAYHVSLASQQWTLTVHDTWCFVSLEEEPPEPINSVDQAVFAALRIPG